MNKENIAQNFIPASRFETHMITVSVMLVAVIEVLDMTIVNVALPHMMGALGATADQITWVLTSYIVSSAVCMPLTGFLVGRFGRKKVLLVDIIAFLIASMLCGAATNLTAMVFFRTLQGIFGATLVPLSQLVLRQTYPPKQQGQAMAIWGIGIMVAPVLGPTIGGYITENINWRWIFYINLPVCVIAILMAMRFITETPTKKESIDWVGLFWMSIGIGSLQLFLDQGNQYNWFDSDFILILFIIAVFGLAYFTTHCLTIRDPIINLHLFRDRNFTVCTLVLMVFCMGMFGVIAIQPIMLENLFNYPADTTGLVMAPRGITSALGMMLVARYINVIDARLIVGAGLIICALGSFIMVQFNLDTDMYWFVMSGAVQGFGMGLVFVPLSSYALATIPHAAMAEGSGLYSFGRSLGSSIGISICATFLSRLTQSNWNRLGGHMREISQQLQQWLHVNNFDITDPIVPLFLGRQLNNQASIIAFVDCFYLTAFMFLAMLPLALLIKPVKHVEGVEMMH